MDTKDGKPDAVLVERARDSLSLDLGGPPSAVTAVGACKEPALEGPVGNGGEDLAWVRQTLRDRRTAPLRFEMAAGGRRREGKQADGALLAVSDPAGAVAVALDHMHRYEPQAPRVPPGGAGRRPPSGL